MRLNAIIRAALAGTIVFTSSVPTYADSYMFRYQSPLMGASNPTDPGSDPGDPGYGIGNDITAFFAGAIGYEFSKVIPVATKDVVDWRRVSGSYQPGLSLDSDTGVISGTASGAPGNYNALLLGYDVNGKAIARANLTFDFHNPVGSPQNVVLYGHTGKYTYREIPSAPGVTVARWESLTTLPDDFHTEGRYLVGTPSKALDTGFAFIGYDYVGKEVAFTFGDLVIQDGPVFNQIASQLHHPNGEFKVAASVQHSVGQVKYRLIDLDGFPQGFTFLDTGKLNGFIRSFSTAYRFQLEALDSDGTSGLSNVFTLRTADPDSNINGITNLAGTVGVPYSIKLSGQDISGTESWQVISGELPKGLSLDDATGEISGTPEEEGKQTGIVVSVSTSDGGYDESSPFSFSVFPDNLVVTFNKKNVRVGEAFATDGPTLTNGVVDPYSFSAASGVTVDPALTVDYTTAKVSGTISSAGSYPVPFAFSNGDGHTATFVQGVSVFNPVSLSYASTIPAYRRTDIGNVFPTVGANSVIGAATFKIETGALPSGLTLNPVTGAIYGSPNAVGQFSGISVALIDASGQKGVSNTFTIDVQDRPSPVVSIGATSLERYVDNDVIALTSANAYGGATYELVAGQLPATLSLRPDGHIVGNTSASEGTYGGLQAKVTDGEGYTGLSPVFSITLANPQGLNPLSIGATTSKWTVGIPFALTLPRPDNAFGNITYELQGASQGVTVQGNTIVGKINGIGSYPFTMKLTDDALRSMTITYTLDILEPMTASLSGSSEQVTTFAMFRMLAAKTFNLPRGSDTSIGAQITNGIEPITYSFSGTLPTGLNYANGVVSGIPVTEGQSSSIVLSVSDAAGTAVQLPATVQVGARLPIDLSYDFASPLVMNWQTGLPKKPVVKNAIGAVNYTVSGSLPAGLSFNDKSGIFTGKPTEDGRFRDITITATDSEGSGFSGTYGPFEIGVKRYGVVSLATNVYHTVRAGQSFIKTPSISNVTNPVVWTPNSGSLPYDLQLGTDGSVSGTFPQTGTYNVTIRATDDFGRSAASTLRFTVIGALAIASPATTSFNQYATVNVKPATSNIIGTARYELVSGTLPAGMALNSSTGAITGTASVKGTASNLVIKVTDSTGTSAQTAAFSLTVTDRLPLTLSTATSYAAFANLKYKLTMPLTNAVGAVTWTQTGTLPAGLTFDKGVFSGIPTVIGTFANISVTATDSVGATVTKTFSFVLTTNGSPIGLTVTSFVTKVGYPILTTKPTTSNTVGDVSFWADAPVADNGLSIDPTTGIISGTATKLLDIAPNVSVTDGSDRVTSKPISIKVIPKMVVNVPSRIDLVVNSAMATVVATRDNVVGSATWTYTGTLPTGVTFAAGAGIFSGTPTEMGTFSGVLKATDTLGDVGQAPVTIVVANNGLPPTISVAYTATGYISTSGTTVTPTYTNKKVGDIVTLAPGSGALPPGFVIANPSGTWLLQKTAGTDADVGVYKGVNLRVTDKDGLYSDSGAKDIVIRPATFLAYPAVSYSKRVNDPISVPAPTPSAGKKIADLSFAFTTDKFGGTVKIDPATGALSGYITAGGTNVVTVTEKYDSTVIRTFTYNVTFAVAPLSMTMGDFATVSGVAYTSRIPVVSNAVANGEFTLTGSIPDGLSIDPATGVISGTPTTTGLYDTTLAFTDDLGTVSQALKISVNDGVAGHRYWKFTPLTYASDGGGQVVALDYYDANGVNAMSMATVLASTPANWANALDNNATTGVSISKTGNYYLALDFKAKVDIHKAVIDTPYLNTIYICLASAKIEWSDDGASWTESGRFSRPAVCTGGSYNRIQTVTW